MSFAGCVRAEGAHGGFLGPRTARRIESHEIKKYTNLDLWGEFVS